MNQFVYIAVVAGLIAFVGTPFTLVLARRFGFISYPNSRQTHIMPIPLMGGVAIWAGFVVSLLVFGRGAEYRELLAIVVGATVIFIVGLVDDRIGLKPLPKLIGQLIAAFALVLGGVQARMFGNAILDVLVTVVWVVGICNAINFSDNMDGLAAGISAVAAGSFLLLAAFNGQVLVSSLAAALLGACLGFLFYNFQPALTFMGDAGSLLLGFMLAVLGIKLSFPGVNPLSTWMAPIVVLGVPIFDTALVIISRLRRQISILRGGADHTSHRLVRLGLSHRRAVLALYSVAAVFGVSAVFMSQSMPVVANVAFGALLLVGLFVLYVLEEVYRQPATSRLRPDIRLTFIGGGADMMPLLEAAITVSRRVSVLITPGAPASGTTRPMSLDNFRQCVAVISEHPEATRAVLANSTGFSPDIPLTDQVVLAEAALRLRGQMVLTTASASPSIVSESALNALHHTDLIVIGGDLNENVLPTLQLPEVARALRRSKRARILIHPEPENALVAIEAAAGPDLITHVIAGLEGEQEWHAAADLRQSRDVAEALSRIWLLRMRVRGAPPPITTGSFYG